MSAIEKQIVADQNYVLAVAVRVENAALKEQIAQRDETIRNLLECFDETGRQRAAPPVDQPSYSDVMERYQLDRNYGMED
jgi:hypothetical protein